MARKPKAEEQGTHAVRVLRGQLDGEGYRLRADELQRAVVAASPGLWAPGVRRDLAQAVLLLHQLADLLDGSAEWLDAEPRNG
ncbi:hypothetical protein [Myxococcus sp. RHSTA-1-4]|uniref:hypothetical protein n=1 Tax=Myxococcus sp. RHSTA-1-4 TaxID=2874601 RepID=UPI001CBEDCA2|nr:hypothetical protein [Myxococcus sp. RHSTA-1-4]MBZ4422015.1 hypothetical protein [Myxococcus sp. RHSTA-1-4]